MKKSNSESRLVEKPRGNTTDKRSERPSSNIFSLAVVIGLFSFFITDELTGGLAGVQGFFIGVVAVIFLFISAEMLKGYRMSKQDKVHQSVPGDVSITHAEGEDGVTIQIFVSTKSASGREANSDK